MIRSLHTSVVALALGCVISPQSPELAPPPEHSAGPPGAPAPAPSGASVPSRSSSTLVEVLTRRAYYEVGGATAATLRAELDKLGPLDRNNIRRDAYTGWSVKWEYEYDRSGGVCRTGPVQVTVEVTYTLPRWNMPTAVDPTLQRRWSRYIRSLHRHEDGHRDIGVHAGEELRRRVEAIAPHPDCASLEREADRLGNAIVHQYRQVEIAYDRDTNHGETQGARFR